MAFIAYIETSVLRLNQAKIEHEQLELEEQEAVTKQLEMEARLQRESAKRAEKDKQQAELSKRVGRELTEEERRRFGVPDSVPLAN